MPEVLTTAPSLAIASPPMSIPLVKANVAPNATLVPPVVSVGLFDYPDDPIGQIRAAGVTVYAFDAGQIARDLGEVRLGNTIMLGAIADYLPFGAEVLKEQVVERFRARKPELAELNERAFEAGRKAAADASAAASSAA